MALIIIYGAIAATRLYRCVIAVPQAIASVAVMQAHRVIRLILQGFSTRPEFAVLPR